MERREAEAIYDAGREVVVEVLLRMDRQIQQLTARVDRLERELRKNSRNSSQPPSQDRPKPPPKGKGRSGRKQGGQRGHEGHGRELLPTSAVDEVVEHWPAACGCGHVFCEADLVASGEPARHQVEELPRIATRVIEHQCHRVRCPGCGARRSGELPADVSASAFGSRFQAAVATLAVRNRVSRRDTVELSQELFGARISTGTVDAILARTGDALELPYLELVGALRRSGRLNIDETGWRLKGQRRTLWGAFTEKLAVYRIAEDRHEDRARELLDGHRGIVTSDRWSAYNHLPLERRQICWSHLQRDFTAQAEAGGAERELGALGADGPCFSSRTRIQPLGDLSRSSRKAASRRRSVFVTLAPSGSLGARGRENPYDREGWHPAIPGKSRSVAPYLFTIVNVSFARSR